MSKFIAGWFLVCCTTFYGQMYHHSMQPTGNDIESYCWEEPKTIPFDELLITWNAKRPEKGEFSIYVSVFGEKWSDWMHYADWGVKGQSSQLSNLKDGTAGVYQDAVEVFNGKKCKGFRVKVVASQGAALKDMDSLHVNACCLNDFVYTPYDLFADSVNIDVQGISQVSLPTPHIHRICSPASTTAVVNFLNGNKAVDAIKFADSCFDKQFDIFGNWVLSVAEAYNQLQDSKYTCWVSRFDDFYKVLDQLHSGYPVVISIKGPIKGSANPYPCGNLIVICGYDAKKQEVICMDPAFSSDSETIVRYPLDELLEAWSRRKNLAYVFTQKPW